MHSQSSPGQQVTEGPSVGPQAELTIPQHRFAPLENSHATPDANGCSQQSPASVHTPSIGTQQRSSPPSSQ
jgi:hypothetical protein